MIDDTSWFCIEQAKCPILLQKYQLMNLPFDKSEKFKSPSSNAATVMIYGGTNVMIYGMGGKVG